MTEQEEAYTRTRAQVLTNLPKCFDSDKYEKEQFFMSFKQHMKDHHIDIREAISRFKDVFNSPFNVVDHLTQCVVSHATDSSFLFPLQRMHCPELSMYYVKNRAPNLAIFLPGKRPSALFTKRGFLTLAGGCNKTEIVECFLICCFKLVFILGKIFPSSNFNFSEFRLFNIVASTTIVLHKIYLPGMIDDLRAHGFQAQFSQESINFCFVQELLPFETSITFCVCATGSINLLGTRYKYQAQCAAIIFAWFLKRHLVKASNITPETFQLAQDVIKQTQHTKAKRKLDDKEKWIETNWKNEDAHRKRARR